MEIFKYLNVQSPPPNRYTTLTENFNIKLEQLYLTLEDTSYATFDSDLLINCIKQFSSSLTSLTLNLVDTVIKNENKFPFNSIKLQYLLESMTELKRFHLYANLDDTLIDRESILLQFQNEYWLNHNWTFGIHGDYFYTLPFHFNHLYQFEDALNNVKSNNPEILINDRRIWYNVKSIDLLEIPMYDINFIKEVQMKMPKLNSIKLIKDSFDRKNKRQELFIDNGEIEQTDVRLDNVRTIDFVHSTSLENKEEWLISMSPNLCHLILSNQQYPPVKSRLASIFNKKIRRLDIDVDFQVDNLAHISHVYFPNVQYINLRITEIVKKPEWYRNIIMKILKKFKNLKTLIIYLCPDRFFTIELLLKHRNSYKSEILTNCEVKHFQGYSTFTKKQL